MSSSNGASVGGGVVAAGDKEVFTVSGNRLGAIIVEVLDTVGTPVGADVEVTVHPLNPAGEPYDTGVDDLVLATEVVAAGKTAVLIDMKDAPGTGFAITVDNTDSDDHEVVLNVLVQG